MADQFVLAGKVTVDAKEGVAALNQTVSSANDVAEAARNVGRASTALVAPTRASAKALHDVADAAGNATAAKQVLQHVIRSTSDSFAAGLPVTMIFGEQIGRITEAAELAGGALGSVGKVLAGPWGLALQAAIAIGSQFAGKLFEQEDATRHAGDAARNLTEALQDLEKASGANHKSAEQAVADAAAVARSFLLQEIATRKLTQAKLDAAITERGTLATRSQQLGASNEAAPLGVPVADAQVANLKALLKEQSDAVAKAQIDLRDASGSVILADVATHLDAAKEASRGYEQAVAGLRKELHDGWIDETKFNAAVDAEAKRRDDLVHAAERERAARAVARREAADAARDEKQFEAALAAIEDKFITGAKAADVYTKQLAVLHRAYGNSIPLEDRSGTFAEYIAGSLNLDKAAAAEKKVNDELTASLKSVQDHFDGAAASAAKYDATIAKIKELGSAGRITPEQVASYAQDAKFQKNIDDDAALAARAKRFADGFQDEMPEIADAGGKRMAATFKLHGLDAGREIGKAIAENLMNGAAPLTNITLKGIGAQIGGNLIATTIDRAIAPITNLVGKVADQASKVIGAPIDLVTGIFSKTKKAIATISASGGVLTVGSASGSSGYLKGTNQAAGGIGDSIEGLAAQLGGDIGNFSVSIGQRKKKFVVDPSGSGRTKGGGTQSFDSMEDAEAAALADAIRDGGITGVSPRVQAVIQQYASDVNKAVAEALKVKNLEDLIADDANPFASAFNSFEQTAKQRLDVATKYGFDLVEIEKINGEQRAKLLQQTLDQATASIKSTIDEIRFGDLAEGSFDQQHTSLLAERDRLAGLAQGGDQDALDKLASISQQLLQLDKEGVGSTDLYANERADTLNLLDGLVKQTQDRINAAAASAQGVTDQTAAQLTEANGSLDDIVAGQQAMLTALAAQPGLIAAALAGVVSGGSPVDSYIRYQDK